MTNMKIQYASDLHLEFADNWRYLKAHPLEVTGDILLLAGDIGYLGDDNYSKHPFWDWASENYKEVHCCMGNHEFYKYYDVATLPDGYLLEVRPNVFSHYNGIARIGDTDIIPLHPLVEDSFGGRLLHRASDKRLPPYII